MIRKLRVDLFIHVLPDFNRIVKKMHGNPSFPERNPPVQSINNSEKEMRIRVMF